MNQEYLTDLVRDILPRSRITWIPDSKATKMTDPLAILLNFAKYNRSVIELVRIVIEYCFCHTITSKNLTFLSPVFASMPKIIEYHYEDALEYMSRMAFIPVERPAHIWRNHVCCENVSPLKFSPWKHIRRTWMSEDEINREEGLNPIMQFRLRTIREVGDTDKDLEKPVFMASFYALYFFLGKDGKKGKNQTMEDGNGGAEGSDNYGEPFVVMKTTRWRVLFHMFRSKLLFQARPVVACHDFSLEFLDNPAIAALVTYKWETIGFAYWFVRFFFQFVYYTLIVAAALLQVYSEEPSKLFGVFVAIITMGSLFVFLEILQAIQDRTRYYRSSYNIVDVLAFVLPMYASIQQLHLIRSQDRDGSQEVLSFSVLVIFLHMLIELRIVKSVCKYVTIIQQALREISTFFIIMAGCIVAFTIALLHLLWSCPYDGCLRKEVGFPKHPFGALLTTFIFLGGRFEPVANELDTAGPSWSFHVAMVIFLLTTTILMMNVLIALINVAFTKGDDAWRLVWIKSRLRYIEAAENLSFQIPGFRQTYDWFPEEIYFTATTKDMEDYLKKHPTSRRKYHSSTVETQPEGDKDHSIPPPPLRFKQASTLSSTAELGGEEEYVASQEATKPVLMTETLQSLSRQMNDVLRQAQESQRQAELNQQQIQALYERMLQLTTPALSLHSSISHQSNQTFSAADAARHLSQEHVSRASQEMFRKVADYIRAEMLATGEDYKLLENMNIVTKDRYSELAGVAQELMQEVGKLRTTYSDFEPYLERIDEISQQAETISNIAAELDEYTNSLELRLKRISK
ncbi:biogenesis of lysosome- organelles complex 1 subunit 2 [Mortierella sp. 14UC]|nr:biogenesis of lysosome- organelles complex 1 subunit 2 [Mortierella sp. 14UC]